MRAASIDPLHVALYQYPVAVVIVAEIVEVGASLWGGFIGRRQTTVFAILAPLSSNAWSTMWFRGTSNFGKSAANRALSGRQGSLAQIVRVDLCQVIKLSVLFSLWILLPLILLLAAQQQIEASIKADHPLVRAETLWGAAIMLFALALSFALAFSIARQQSLAAALEQAVDNLPLQFAYIDAERCFRFNNRAHLETCIKPACNFHGRTVREVLGEETYRQVEPYLERALAGERVDFELSQSDARGCCNYSVSYLPDVSDGGQVKGLFMLADDITARKQAERRDKEQLLEFAQISRLASVGEVAAEIAHQINQPLAAIALFSSAAARTLAGGGDQTQVRGWLESINGQSKRASEVIGSLRRFVRPGRLEPTRLDLNSPLREVAALLTHNADACQVTLNLELGDALPPVMAAGILIEQVVFNLVRNAIQVAADQSEPGQVTIRSRADAERVWVEVFGDGPVQNAFPGDSGCVPDDVSPDAWLGFSQAISRSIIAGLDGDAGCRCDQGGTFCYFNLPRCA